MESLPELPKMVMSPEPLSKRVSLPVPPSTGLSRC
jgi:hypothetical protein